MLVECELSKVVVNEVRDQQMVYVRELAEPHREFPILIGIVEAMAIERKLKNQPVERPLTHDLVVSVIEEMGGRLERIIVNDLKSGTFFAQLEVHMPGRKGPLLIDSRPSDAIAVAVRCRCRIFVHEQVFQKAETGDE